MVITQHPFVKRWLIFSCNDEGVLGAVRALENRGFDAESVIGIGIGGSSSQSEFEKEEKTGFFATAFVNANRHGFDTTAMLYKWINEGIEPPKNTSTTGEILTKETYPRVMKERNISE